MARTALPVSPLVANGALAAPAGTAGAADGHYVDTNTRTKINDDVKPEDLVLHVTVATAATDLIVRAGDYPPALAKHQGDLTVNLAVGTHFVGPFEAGRFLRNDGRVHVDYGTPANVTVRAVRVPRAV